MATDNSSTPRELIYLASPYSHPNANVREDRFRRVCRVAAKLMRAGHLIFSPIAHTHPIAAVGDLPLGFDYWEGYDRVVMESCGAVWVVMLDGWEESHGVGVEIDIAKELGLPIIFLTEEGEPA